MIAKVLSLAAVIALLASPAVAAPLTLKAAPLDDDGKVTLGEVFDGVSGAAAGVVVATRSGPLVVLDGAVLRQAAARQGLVWENTQGLKRIIVRAGAGAPSAASASPASAVAGPERGVEVLTYATSIATGDVIQAQDLVWTKLAAAPAGALEDADDLIGLIAKRPLRAGAPAYARDAAQPRAIKSGELINVTWSNGPVSLTLQAKAMADAAVGETINVQNITSKKVLQAVASGPGQAVVGPQAAQIRQTRPGQLALR